MTKEISLIECSFAIPVALSNTYNTNFIVAITLSWYFGFWSILALFGHRILSA